MSGVLARHASPACELQTLGDARGLCCSRAGSSRAGGRRQLDALSRLRMADERNTMKQSHVDAAVALHLPARRRLSVHQAMRPGRPRVSVLGFLAVCSIASRRDETEQE